MIGRVREFPLDLVQSAEAHRLPYEMQGTVAISFRSVPGITRRSREYVGSGVSDNLSRAHVVL